MQSLLVLAGYVIDHGRARARRCRMIGRGRRALLQAGLAVRPAAGVQLPLLSSSVSLDAPVEPAAVPDDIDVFQRAYRAFHPGLERYQTPAELDARVAALRAWAAQPRPLAQWILELARITAAPRCGHSCPNPLYQRRAVREEPQASTRPLPASTRWIDCRLVVARPKPDAGVDRVRKAAPRRVLA